MFECRCADILYVKRQQVLGYPPHVSVKLMLKMECEILSERDVNIQIVIYIHRIIILAVVPSFAQCILNPEWYMSLGEDVKPQDARAHQDAMMSRVEGVVFARTTRNLEWLMYLIPTVKNVTCLPATEFLVARRLDVLATENRG